MAPPINYNTNRFTMNDSGVVTQNNPSSASWGWVYSESIIRQTLKAGTYTASFDAETLSLATSAQMYVFDSANNQLATTGNHQNAKQGSCTFTITEETEIGICAKMYDGAWKFQLELGTTATSYEPYKGDTYTTVLGRTVYGGTLDVVSGVLTVDRVKLSTTWGNFSKSSTGNFTRGSLWVGLDNIVYPQHDDKPQICNVAPLDVNFSRDNITFLLQQ